MKRPNIPARLSFDSRGINDASSDYAPRLFTITAGRTNDPQTQALGHALAAVPALLEALEQVANTEPRQSRKGSKSSPLIELDAVLDLKRVARSALIAAGYQF